MTSAVGMNTTAPGTILGTMQYMAPEQLEGKEADARTDIFAFGAVLYEMVTGRKAFEGKSQPHLIAAIVSAQPDPISKTQPTMPAALDFLVERCLAKDPDERLQTATDLVSKLRWIAEGGTEGGARGIGVSDARRATARAARARRRRRCWSRRCRCCVVDVRQRHGRAAGESLPRSTCRTCPSPKRSRSPLTAARSRIRRPVAARRRVFVRPLDTDVATKLAGTEGAGRLFWSPDSRWIAFFADGKLKKVDAAGGSAAEHLRDAGSAGRHLERGRRHRLRLEQGTAARARRGRRAVADCGGRRIRSAASARTVFPARWPALSLLWRAAAGKGSDAAIYAGSLDSTDATRLVAAQSNAVYAEPGYLLFHREGTLYAQAFDPKQPDAQRRSGSPCRQDPLRHRRRGRVRGVAHRRPDLSERSAAPSAAGGAATHSRRRCWIGRCAGSAGPARANRPPQPGGWAGVDLSPDGKRAAVHRHDPDGGDVWIFEAGNTTPSKFTFDAAQDNSSPIWSPDGTRIAFGSRRNGKWGLYVKLADNTRARRAGDRVGAAHHADELVRRPAGLLDQRSQDRRRHLERARLTGDKKPVPILQTRGRRAESPGVAGREVDRLQLERNRPERDLHQAVSGRPRQDSGLGQRRRVSALAPRRQGTVFHEPRHARRR